MSGKSRSIANFTAFSTVPDFAEISGNLRYSYIDRRHLDLSGGSWELRRSKFGTELKLLPSFHMTGMIADHRRNLGRVVKIETLPIYPICLRPSQGMLTISIILVGKVWDGRETVKSPIVWNFPDISVTYETYNPGQYFQGQIRK